jgi:hypothetical protein
MIMCLKSWGIVNEDIYNEDKEEERDYSIKDQEEAYFVL